jgi:iron complex outermembrane receptor protein
VDLNGDGDCQDTVRIFDPSLTHTERVTVNTSLIWTINHDNLIRAGFTYDHSHHRQDGPADFLNADGTVSCPYGYYDSCGTPVLAADGSLIQRRNRLTIMTNYQFTVEYVGKFFDEHLGIEAGLRDPHYGRDLNQYCWSSIGGSNVYCTTNPPINQTTGAGIPVTGLYSGSGFIIPPFHAHVSYTKPLPQAGVSWRFDSANQVYFNFAEQYRLPVNDDLYTVGYDTTTKQVLIDNVQPESSDTYELGYRYQTPNLLASLTLWDTEFQNRIVSSYNQDLDTYTDRNVGDVSLRGVDVAAGWKPPVVQGLSLNGTFSYLYSRFDDNITNFNAAGLVEPTQGKTLPESPEITIGGRVQYSISDFDFGLQAKYTSSRFVTDLNDLKVSGYTVWDLDARWRLDRIHPGSYLQLNVTNLFNVRYFGSLANETPTNVVTSPFYNGASYAYQGPPRAISVTWRQTF